jgi:hypothetical protein
MMRIDYRKITSKLLFIALWAIPIFLFTYSVAVKAGVFPSLSKNQPMELIADMDNGLALKPQSENKFFKNRGAESFRPKGAVPFSGKAYSLESIDVEASAVNGENPLPRTDFVYARGENLYSTHCVYCHNTDGSGEGAIMTKIILKKDEEPFPGPPDLRTAPSAKLPDYRVFHILSAGQNLMYSVAYKLSVPDRWALVRYLRILQGLERNDK